MREVLGLIVVVAQILGSARGRAKWYLIETEDKIDQDYSKVETQGCRDVGGSGKFLKVGETWTSPGCSIHQCHGPDIVSALSPPPPLPCRDGERNVGPQYPECVPKCVPHNKDDNESNGDYGDDSEGCRDPQNGKLYKAGETWFTEDCITHGCDEQGNIFGMSASSTCKAGERRVEPQYPECVQKCVPDNEGSHGNNEDDGDDTKG